MLFDEAQSSREILLEPHKVNLRLLVLGLWG